LSNVMIDRNKRGNFSGRIGNGGALISAKGINGNIRLTRGSWAANASEPVKEKADTDSK